MSFEMYCIVCDRELKPAMTDGAGRVDVPPSRALVCYTHGNFGSTVFDPMGGDTRLEFYVCDDCAVQQSSRIYRVTPRAVEQLYEPWDPKAGSRREP